MDNSNGESGLAKSRLHIAASIAVTLVLSAYALFSAEAISSQTRTQLEKKLSRSIEMVSSEIVMDLRHLVYSMLFIVDQTRLHRPFHTMKGKHILAEDFISFLNSSPLFDQLRLIDLNGNELIRANHNNGAPILARPEELQNKAGRYYVQEALKLENNDIFLSPLDLNVEHGKVEQPIKPTLRMASLSFNQTDDRDGIIVINTLAQGLLDHFALHSSQAGEHHFYWLNRDGYWLAGEKPERLWGFMFEERAEQTLAERDPEAWQVISSQSEGTAYGSDGIYLFKTIDPELTIANGEHHFSIKSPSHWKMVAFYSHDEFESLIAEKRFNHHLMLGTVAAILIAIFWFLGRCHNQRLCRMLVQEQQHELELKKQRIKSITTIAGGLAHEFNNILAAISGSIYMLQRNVIHADQKRHLSKVDTLTKRAARLVNDLLTFSQMGIIRWQELNLSTLISSSCNTMAEELPTGIHMQLQCDSDIWIEGDSQKIAAMIKELLLNARQALGNNPDGQISVGLKQCEYQFSDSAGKAHSGAFAHLCIHDNGSGINEEDIPHIFDPFFTTRLVGQGSGLGLSMVYGTVMIHHGDISVDSAPKTGTRVEIYLPVVQPKKRPRKKVSSR